MSNFLIDEDTDLLAAEFVLGTLDSQERVNAQAQLRTDHGFIAMVRIWERRFGELHLMVEPVDPDAKIFERIKAKIAEIAPAQPAPEGKPAPDGKSAVEASPQPAAATPGPDIAKPAETPDTLPNAEVPEPSDATAPVAVVDPADGTAPKPPDAAAGETAPSEEAGKPLALPPAPGLVVPDPITQSAVVAPAVAKDEIPASPAPAPPLVTLPDKAPDHAGERAAQQAKITTDVIHSRNRWRRVGVFMILVTVGLAALLAAWRFIPDRLPARLRPAELMTSLGIQPPPAGAPAARPAAPDGQFEE
jgi:hypothetical protein